MFALHDIQLTNFRSFKGTHKFEFPQEPGLYFFGGINLHDKIGANGAGKSTFLDAIVWCLYGRTSRGLKANDIISWGAKSCNVTVTLTVGDRSYQIKRSQHPNGLSIDKRPVDQIELEKHIRLNFDSFLHTILNAQFGTSFFSLTPSEKLTTFSNIMDLDFWLHKSAIAADKSVELELLIRKTSDALEYLRSRKKDAQNLLNDARDRINDYKKNKTVRIENLKQHIAKAKADLGNLNVEYAIESTKDELIRLNLTIEAHLANISHAVKLKAMGEGRLKELLSIPNSGSICPTCRQLVDPKHAKEHLTTIAVIEKQIDGAEWDLDAYKKGLIRTKTKIVSLNARLEQFYEEKSKRQSLKDQVKRLQDQLLDLKNESNPWEDTLAVRTNDLKAINIRIKGKKDALNYEEAAFEAADFWIKGFKRIRLYIIEQTFRALEIEVNNSLTQLGMPDWQITFDIERENKSGGVTKGFVVFIKSPHNKVPVRWENWSGGETQRLQLAGDLGLSNLIMTQAGLNNTVEFYDEPSTHLSQEGMLDLADLLHERALDEDKCIWIVDHTAITNFGDFKGVITAKKDANGSSISFRDG
jgi:DNA repair exonuclease SbcCD ATPase subunit